MNVHTFLTTYVRPSAPYLPYIIYTEIGANITTIPTKAILVVDMIFQL